MINVRNIDIVFIIIDALRKDYAEIIENGLVKHGFVKYENVIAPASWTIPSCASILTGIYPAFHNAHETREVKGLSVKLRRRDILSVILKELGYSTILLSANPYLRPSNGFRFDYYHDFLYRPSSLILLSSREREEVRRLKAKHRVEGKAKTARMLLSEGRYKLLVKMTIGSFIKKPYGYIQGLLSNWPLDKGAGKMVSKFTDIISNIQIDRPRFIFINFMEVHEPYFNDPCGKLTFHYNFVTGKEEIFNEQCLEKLRRAYRREVEYISNKLLELLGKLDEVNMMNNSLIIVTSDHGQMLGEHGRISHGTFLDDELLRVPLLIRYPNNLDVEIAENTEGYISLIRLRRLIIELVKGKLANDNILYSDVALAESFGVHQNVAKLLKDEERRRMEEYEKYRIAIYWRGIRALYNVDDSRFEEISPEASMRERRHLMKIIKRHLRMAHIVKALKGR